MLIGALIMMFVTSAKLSALVFSRFRSSFCRSSASAALFAACRATPRIRSAMPRLTRQKISPRYRTMQAYVNEKSGFGSVRPRRRARLRGGASTHESAGGADGHCDIPDRRQRHRRSLVRRIRRHRRRNDRWPARSVRPLRAVRGRRARRAFRGLGRNQPGGRRCRAAFRDDGDGAGYPLARAIRFRCRNRRSVRSRSRT